MSLIEFPARIRIQTLISEGRHQTGMPGLQGHREESKMMGLAPLLKCPVPACVTFHCSFGPVKTAVLPVLHGQRRQEEASLVLVSIFLHFRNFGTFGAQLPWCRPFSLPPVLRW